MKVPTIDTGTASTGISVARRLCRNTNTTITTSTSASKNVWTTSEIDARVNSVVSIAMLVVEPLGKRLLHLRQRRAHLLRHVERVGARLLVDRDDRRRLALELAADRIVLAGPSSARPMSFRRTIAAPPFAARMMMLSNSVGSASRPVVVTANDCSTGERRRRLRRCCPTANCWFWLATAFCTSLAVMPSCAMRSGLSQMRIA